eukprot:scaffold80697_cov69-Phaeocystis_antarctica.AAC.6
MTAASRAACTTGSTSTSASTSVASTSTSTACTSTSTFSPYPPIPPGRGGAAPASDPATAPSVAGACSAAARHAATRLTARSPLGPWYTAYLRSVAVTCSTSVQPAGIRPDKGPARTWLRRCFFALHGVCCPGRSGARTAAENPSPGASSSPEAASHPSYKQSVPPTSSAAPPLPPSASSYPPRPMSGKGMQFGSIVPPAPTELRI